MEKIKDKLGMGHSHHHTTGTTRATRSTGTTGATHTTGTTGTTGREGEQICVNTNAAETGARRDEVHTGTAHYTATEEQATIKERVETVREHRPVEKQYVVETKEVGERALPKQVESMGVEERVIEEGGGRQQAQGETICFTPTTGTEENRPSTKERGSYGKERGSHVPEIP